jgi:hypothetical protein
MKKDPRNSGNAICVKSPHIVPYEGFIPWWKMELILEVLGLPDSPSNVEYYRLLPRKKS